MKYKYMIRTIDFLYKYYYIFIILDTIYKNM